MDKTSGPRRGGRFPWKEMGLAMAALLGIAGFGLAQNPPSGALTGNASVGLPTIPIPPAPAAGRAEVAHAVRNGALPEGTLVDGNLVQTGCSTCGGGLSMPEPGGILHGGSGCSTCGGGNCYPGRTDSCDECEGRTAFGRFFCALYSCICCPDPCYEPKWKPLADSAFFVTAARPVTQMALRWDTGFNLKNPDRAEYYWARVRANGAKNGGNAPGSGKGPNVVPRGIDYEELSLYTEGASGGFGAFVQVPYRHLSVDASATSGRVGAAAVFPDSSGFADMTVGTKSLLLDCELIQLALGFKTYLPTGAFTKGLGTGHVSLEPSLLATVKLGADCYLQTELAYWIPIGGDDLYQGNIFHTHWSINKELCRPLSNVQVVGTLELNHWTVLNGNFTVSDLLAGANNDRAVVNNARTSMVSIGPGVRVFVCEKIDFGVGTAFALTGTRWAEQLIRAEFRWRF